MVNGVEFWVELLETEAKALQKSLQDGMTGKWCIGYIPAQQTNVWKFELEPQEDVPKWYEKAKAAIKNCLPKGTRVTLWKIVSTSEEVSA